MKELGLRLGETVWRSIRRSVPGSRCPAERHAPENGADESPTVQAEGPTAALGSSL